MEIIVWPTYINSKLSLSKGRKIAKEYCVAEPKHKEIVKALYKLKLNFTNEENKSYPGKWYEKTGRVIVETDKSKKELLINIASLIKSFRN